MGKPKALLADASVGRRRVPEPRDRNAEEDGGEDPSYSVAYTHAHHEPAESCDLFADEESEELK